MQQRSVLGILAQCPTTASYSVSSLGRSQDCNHWIASTYTTGTFRIICTCGCGGRHYAHSPSQVTGGEPPTKKDQVMPFLVWWFSSATGRTLIVGKISTHRKRIQRRLGSIRYNWNDTESISRAPAHGRHTQTDKCISLGARESPHVVF